MIHTVGTIVSGKLTQRDCDLLASCYRSCLELAERNGIESIAICCISTGEYHFPNQPAAKIALDTVSRYISEKESDIKAIFNVFKECDEEIYRKLLWQIDRLAQVLQEADAVLIGAGAGLSTSAGLAYTGERFEQNFAEFIAKYHFRDMYSATFYPYESPEAYWAYMSRHIDLNRHAAPVGIPYRALLDIARGKDYFVLTTNVDHQFQRAGFDKRRLFYTQGDCGLWQCSVPCHAQSYDNETAVKDTLARQNICVSRLN